MKTILLVILAVLGSLITVANYCLMISTSMRDVMEEELFIGKENESQGKDRPEDDKRWSCAGKPEQ